MKFEDKDHIERITRETISYFMLFEKEVSVYQDNFSERIRLAESGDKDSVNRLLGYVRACMFKKELVDPLVADWLANNLYFYLIQGIDLKKALGLSETGRPKSTNQIRDLFYWEQVELYKFDGMSKLDAMILVAEDRERLYLQLKKMGEDHHYTPSGIATIDQCHKKGWRLVKQYLEETNR